MLAEGDLYVLREADRRVVDALSRGEPIVLLGGRQTGKSSMLERARRALLAPERLVAKISMEGVGGGETDAQFFATLVHECTRALPRDVARAIRDEEKAATHLAPSVRWSNAIERILEGESDRKLVVLFDELDSLLRLPRDRAHDFWVQCRRVIQTYPSRVTMAFAGVIEPDLLRVDKDTTPFNLGDRIRLDDLPRDGFDPKWLRELAPEPAAMLDDVFAWTAGHPYLTMKTLLARRAHPTEPIDALVDRLFLGDTVEDHCLRAIDGFFRRSPSEINAQSAPDKASARIDEQTTSDMLSIYRAIRKGERIVFDSSVEPQLRLRLVGLAIDREGADRQRVLEQRNKIFETVFDERWIAAKQRNLSRPLLDRALVWAASGRRDDDLLRGEALAAAEARIEAAHDLTEDERAFVEASRKHNAAENIRQLEAQAAEERAQAAEERAQAAEERAHAKQKQQQLEAKSRVDRARRNAAIVTVGAIALIFAAATAVALALLNRAKNAESVAVAQRGRAEASAAAEAQQRAIAEQLRSRAEQLADAEAQQRVRAEGLAAAEAQQRATAVAAADAATQSALLAESERAAANILRRLAIRASVAARATAAARAADPIDLSPSVLDSTRRVVADFGQLDAPSDEGARQRGETLTALSGAMRAAWDTSIEAQNVDATFGPDRARALFSHTGSEVAVLYEEDLPTGGTGPFLRRFSGLRSSSPQSHPFSLRASIVEASWSPSGNVLFVLSTGGALYRWDRAEDAPALYAENCHRFRVAGPSQVLCWHPRDGAPRWCTASGRCASIELPPSVSIQNALDVVVRAGTQDFWLIGRDDTRFVRRDGGRVVAESLPASGGFREAFVRVSRAYALPDVSGAPSQWMGVTDSGDLVRWSRAGDQWGLAEIKLTNQSPLRARRIIPASDGRTVLVESSSNRLAMLSIDPRSMSTYSIRELQPGELIGGGWSGDSPIAMSANGRIMRWQRGERWELDRDQSNVRRAAWSARTNDTHLLATIAPDGELVVRDGTTARREATFSVPASSLLRWSSTATLACVGPDRVVFWSRGSTSRTLTIAAPPLVDAEWDGETLVLFDRDGGARSIDPRNNGTIGARAPGPCANPGTAMSPTDRRRWTLCDDALFVGNSRITGIAASNVASASSSGPSTLWLGTNDGRVMRGTIDGSSPPTAGWSPQQGTSIRRIAARAQHVAFEAQSQTISEVRLTRNDLSTPRIVARNYGDLLELQWLDDTRLLVVGSRAVLVFAVDHPERNVRFDATSFFAGAYPSANGDRLLLVQVTGQARIVALDIGVVRAILSRRIASIDSAQRGPR
jgi:hypothetical protein